MDSSASSAPFGDEEQPPPKLGPYRIESTLGGGGQAMVYRAVDERHGRAVALKVLFPGRASRTDPKYRERFLREGRLAAKLHHPNIVVVHDVGQDGKWDYLAMEIVEGASVDDLLKRERRLPEARALPIALGVARALEAATGAGILHRDIKPQNILITRDGTAKLADLGMAKESGDEESTQLTAKGIVLGTSLYMSPEQAMGELTLDARADLYSLGITLFQMLAGGIPLQGENATKTLLRHIQEDVPPPSRWERSVSAETDAIVLGMTVRDRDDRYPSFGTLAADIELVIAGQPAAWARQNVPGPGGAAPDASDASGATVKGNLGATQVGGLGATVVGRLDATPAGGALDATVRGDLGAPPIGGGGAPASVPVAPAPLAPAPVPAPPPVPGPPTDAPAPTGGAGLAAAALGIAQDSSALRASAAAGPPQVASSIPPPAAPVTPPVIPPGRVPTVSSKAEPRSETGKTRRPPTRPVTRRKTHKVEARPANGSAAPVAIVVGGLLVVLAAIGFVAASFLGGSTDPVVAPGGTRGPSVADRLRGHGDDPDPGVGAAADEDDHDDDDDEPGVPPAGDDDAPDPTAPRPDAETLAATREQWGQLRNGDERALARLSMSERLAALPHVADAASARVAAEIIETRRALSRWLVDGEPVSALTRLEARLIATRAAAEALPGGETREALVELATLQRDAIAPYIAGVQNLRIISVPWATAREARRLSREKRRGAWRNVPGGVVTTEPVTLELPGLERLSHFEIEGLTPGSVGVELRAADGSGPAIHAIIEPGQPLVTGVGPLPALPPPRPGAAMSVCHVQIGAGEPESAELSIQGVPVEVPEALRGRAILGIIRLPTDTLIRRVRAFAVAERSPLAADQLREREGGAAREAFTFSVLPSGEIEGNVGDVEAEEAMIRGSGGHSFVSMPVAGASKVRFRFQASAAPATASLWLMGAVMTIEGRQGYGPISVRVNGAPAALRRDLRMVHWHSFRVELNDLVRAGENVIEIGLHEDASSGIWIKDVWVFLR